MSDREEASHQEAVDPHDNLVILETLSWTSGAGGLSSVDREEVLTQVRHASALVRVDSKGPGERKGRRLWERCILLFLIMT